MTKSDIANILADKKGIKKSEAIDSINIIIRAIRDGVDSDGKVALMGLGTFKKYNTKRRIGRNPSTGESMTLYPKKVVKFKASKYFF